MTNATAMQSTTPRPDDQTTCPHVSVVIATFNRPESVARLLRELAAQSLGQDRFEVIVVDDGSTIPVRPRVASLVLPYRMRLIQQANAGPAAARHRGIECARGDIVVILDDDMSVPTDFLEKHAAEHTEHSRRVVLGGLRPHPVRPLPLFDRYHLAVVNRMRADVRAGHTALRGSNLYSGNVSLRRADYLAAGGFDPAFRLSEDAELGIRLERAGATFALSDAACAVHMSDHTSVTGWMRRALAYGMADARVAEKHPNLESADPWRFLPMVSPLSRPLLLASSLAPTVMRPVAYMGMGVSLALGRIGAERLAIAGATFVYGVQYFAGVRARAGSRRGVLGQLRRYLNEAQSRNLGWAGKTAKCIADICADHEAVQNADAKYRAGARPLGVLHDAVHRIGCQMMVAYRVMRLCRDLGLTTLAKIASRMMRHLYAADIHWDADLAPGVMIVHGNGIVIGSAARVGPGCILFQNVTLGSSMGAETRDIGSPTLEGDVHVGPGATLLGPITIGRRTKIMAGACVMRSIPPDCVVETAASSVRPRGSASQPGDAVP